jgi:hypothetical protein
LRIEDPRDELAVTCESVASGALAGKYRLTLVTIRCTSATGNGGTQRVAFSTSKAAVIAAGLILRRRIVPARLVSVLLRVPMGICAAVIDGVSLLKGLVRRVSKVAGSGAQRYSQGDRPGSQQYGRPLGWILGGTTT